MPLFVPSNFSFSRGKSTTAPRDVASEGPAADPLSIYTKFDNLRMRHFQIRQVIFLPKVSPFIRSKWPPNSTAQHQIHPYHYCRVTVQLADQATAAAAPSSSPSSLPSSIPVGSLSSIPSIAQSTNIPMRVCVSLSLIGYNNNDENTSGKDITATSLQNIDINKYSKPQQLLLQQVTEQINAIFGRDR